MKQKKYFIYIFKPSISIRILYSQYFVYINKVFHLYRQSTVNIEYILIIRYIHVFPFVYSIKRVHSCRQEIVYMLPTCLNCLIINTAVEM